MTSPSNSITAPTSESAHTSRVDSKLGVESEVGRLRKVIVHRPDLSLMRLTPSNREDLLFDDVLWVARAQEEHDQFVRLMNERGVEVFYVHELLGEALAASDKARMQVIEEVASDYTVGWALVDEVRQLLAGMSPHTLARHLIGGLTVGELDPDWRRLRKKSLIAAVVDDDSAFVMPPLPNTLFTRDSSAWVYSGVTVNPMFWPARRRESLNLLTIYRYHPMFAAGEWEFLNPLIDRDDHSQFPLNGFGGASMEGGDIQPIGNGTVLIGLSERTNARMIEEVAARLFAKGIGERVIAVPMPKDRAHMHLDTVFTMLDRDKATGYPPVVHNMTAISLRPADKEGCLEATEEKSFLSAVADALGVKKLTLVETGGDRCEAEREQWDDANNTLALEPGVVMAYECNVFTSMKMREAGVEVVEMPGFELGKGRGGAHCMTCPFLRDGI